ncbi:UDP-N-acetylglucosamine--N-acetylmuramyl-(pentapeptide) pyrophosphoryl-undecaprenol N-acetylglucosamine transferase, partial [Streptomyces sp. Ncost-T6T-2b]
YETVPRRRRVGRRDADDLLVGMVYEAIAARR